MELPDELRLEVLSHLDYSSLKLCERVSKTFKTSVKNAAFDKTLSRSSAVIGAKDTIVAADVKLHPSFERMTYSCSGEIDDVELYNFNDGEDWPLLTTTCAAKEHATEPPVSVLRLQIHDLKPFQVEGKNGVTVL